MKELYSIHSTWQRRLAVSAMTALSTWGVHHGLLAQDAPSTRTPATQGYVELLSENDFWVLHGTDRYYTNGGALSLTLNTTPDVVFAWLPKLLPPIPKPSHEPNAPAEIFWSTRYAFTQQMFTPAKISISDKISTDRPYAGWMFWSVTVNRDMRVNGCIKFKNCVDDTLELQVGVVGPTSQADDTQATWHRWFGLNRPMGWSHQIRNEPGLLLRYSRAYPVRHTWGAVGIEGAPVFEAAAGTIAIYAKGGARLRVGYNFDDDVMRGAWSAADRKPSVYLFSELTGGVSAHNLFLAGNTFRKRSDNIAHVSQKNILSEFRTGAVVSLGSWRLSYTHVWKSREFERQDHGHKYGGVTLGATFPL